MVRGAENRALRESEGVLTVLLKMVLLENRGHTSCKQLHLSLEQQS